MDIQVRLVTTEEEFDCWYEIYSQIFTHKEDNFPKELMHSWWPHCLCYLILLNGNAIGMNFSNVKKEYSVGMGYYQGLLKEFRGKNIYSNASILLEEDLKNRGAKIIVFESENPKEQSDNSSKLDALKRLRSFVKKDGYNYIIDSKVPYLRAFPPAIENYENLIQIGFLLGFKVLQPNNLHLSNAVEAITYEQFKQLYFYENLMESGFKTLEEASENRIAVKEFLISLEQNKGREFQILNKYNIDSYSEQFKDILHK